MQFLRRKVYSWRQSKERSLRRKTWTRSRLRCPKSVLSWSTLWKYFQEGKKRSWKYKYDVWPCCFLPPLVVVFFLRRSFREVVTSIHEFSLYDPDGASLRCNEFGCFIPCQDWCCWLLSFISIKKSRSRHCYASPSPKKAVYPWSAFIQNQDWFLLNFFLLCNKLSYHDGFRDEQLVFLIIISLFPLQPFLRRQDKFPLDWPGRQSFESYILLFPQKGTCAHETVKTGSRTSN